MTGPSQASPPPTTLGAPWGRGCPMSPQKHGRSCRTSSTLQHHSPGGALATVTCSYFVGWHRWTLGWAIWYTTRRRRCQPPALRRARHPERGGATEAPQAFRHGEHMGRVGFIPVVFPPGMAGHPCLILRATSLSLQENRRILGRDDLGPPFVLGGQEIGLGSRNLRPRAQVQGGVTFHGARCL